MIEIGCKRNLLFLMEKKINKSIIPDGKREDQNESQLRFFY